MRLYVIRSEAHRLISSGFVLKDADGRALALTSIKPIVAHKSLRLLDDGHELLAYSAVDLSTVLRIKMVVANNGEHNISPWLEFSVCNSISARATYPPPFRVNGNSDIPVDVARTAFI